ncbi:protein REDOX 2-like [Macadamia integrifolia]|uniref:protein REDOX 2-like n=1 Tax=Macadamia integrifolia TaxID=60698 RepID=UPI001C4FCCA6|nr:protein REDOX 2-like [Macadamia integrifolia]
MEKAEVIPEVVLSSGHRMPLIGLGTAGNPLPSNLTSILVDAIENGYRHFDTAAIYGSEGFVGEAVAQALEQGLIKSRGDVFVTSKLWCTDADPDLVLPALKKTLQLVSGARSKSNCEELQQGKDERKSPYLRLGTYPRRIG